MAFRTNHRFQRTERDRTKQAKKEEKAKERQGCSDASLGPDVPERPGEHGRLEE
jgi:hypothetical protein